MARSGLDRGSRSMNVSSRVAGGGGFPKRLDLGTADLGTNDGRDYVDDWMEKNMAPIVASFVRDYCTSFVRWDLLRLLHAGPAESSVESLASAIGANHVMAMDELETLEALGLVLRQEKKGRTSYRLTHGSELGRALDSAVRAFDADKDFRFAVVYAIVRSSQAGGASD